LKFVVPALSGQEVDMTCGRRVNHQKRHLPVYLVVAAATTVVVAVMIGSTLKVSRLFSGYVF
jgi:hypothetical protein